MTITAVNTDQRVQRRSYKGVISLPVTEEACSLHFSLWTVREGNHVFGPCLICISWNESYMNTFKKVK
ncbi:hypothetical protein ACK8P5_13590 [Paenibacillus sp. EC2-1]|uniref:hypothetical protein n=1 Tax=Paenibacillus sp. EC2-1 TaxID=3388665 RepID=UPI003BEEF0A9